MIHACLFVGGINIYIHIYMRIVHTQMTTFSVTYGRWAESYDRSMARRASVERQERLEMEREGDFRRQRAEEEFQVRSV